MYTSNVNTSSIKMDSIQEVMIEAGEHYQIESGDQLILYFINKGALKSVQAENCFELKKWNVILLNPNQQVRLEAIRRTEAIQVNLSGIVITSSAAIKSNEPFFIIYDQHHMIKRYLDLIYYETEHPFRSTDLVLRRLIEAMMVHILRNKHLSIKNAASQVRHDEVEQVEDYIRQHFNEKITLDQLATEVDINKYYLIRLFKQKNGLSPIDYLIHVRLAEAEKLLVKTNLPISQISNQIGFHSPSHFSKTFRKSNHMTPSQYRKKHQSNFMSK